MTKDDKFRIELDKLTIEILLDFLGELLSVFFFD
jgi:hypothetical protein